MKKKNKEWEPNESDLDRIIVKCDCGNQFTVPWDVMAFGFLKEMCCGKCGQQGNITYLRDVNNEDKC